MTSDALAAAAELRREICTGVTPGGSANGDLSRQRLLRPEHDPMDYHDAQVPHE